MRAIHVIGGENSVPGINEALELMAENPQAVHPHESFMLNEPGDTRLGPPQCTLKARSSRPPET